MNSIKQHIKPFFYSPRFRIIFLAVGFLFLIILRLILKEFGISLGYTYLVLIALAGFWFGIAGGLVAAGIASLIFFIEVHVFQDYAIYSLDCIFIKRHCHGILFGD